MNRIKVATKLWLFISAVILALSLLAALGLVRSATLLREGEASLGVSAELVKIASQWTGLSETNGVRNQAILLSGDGPIEASFSAAADETSGRISALQEKLEAMPLSDADRAQLKRIGELRKAVIAARAGARQLKKDGKAEEALAQAKQVYEPAMAAYLGAQKELVGMQEKRVLDVESDIESRRRVNAFALLLALAATVAVIGICTTRLVRSIREPLALANDCAEHIAQGDLSRSIKAQRQDEFGSLLLSLDRMGGSLGAMVRQVRRSTDSIATASAEIALGNNDLARRTEQTSSNLQSTASSMDQLTGTVQQNAANARQASLLASNASAVAERGGAVVREVVTTMEQINASSRRVSDIIAVIDGIAFQTNILALNAAVEAARAGEQGRGFAVVASEVRSLAQRSAAAAKEIKSLIDDSVMRVASGARLVTDAGATMAEIVDSVRRVSDVVGEITAAAGEQSAGIAHVNEAINKLDQMTQQNSALVEQSSAAAESLRDQSQQLAQAVGAFKING